MIPGCNEAMVEIPGGTGEENVTIDYTYDPLYLLTAADYDTGEFFHFTYDVVGNRMTPETHEETNNYIYDIANRLSEVDGVMNRGDDNRILYLMVAGRKPTITPTWAPFR